MKIKFGIKQAIQLMQRLIHVAIFRAPLAHQVRFSGYNMIWVVKIQLFSKDILIFFLQLRVTLLPTPVKILFEKRSKILLEKRSKILVIQLGKRVLIWHISLRQLKLGHRATQKMQRLLIYFSMSEPPAATRVDKKEGRLGENLGLKTTFFPLLIYYLTRNVWPWIF